MAVVVPARNEAPTIGAIVTAVQAELVAATGLVDELIVMDSRSSDDTAARAAAAGARVHEVDAIRPDLGAYAGKGEAIWKSQFVTDSDIVVFIDGDLTEWGPHFVTGLLGPLLDEPEVQLCKGFYDRRFRGDPADESVTGGRVTELVARPLLNLYWPELAAVVQPLGGEWAIRRALLADAAGAGRLRRRVRHPDRHLDAGHGLAAIAQVDLGERGHTHQSVHDLGVMAAEILTVGRPPARADAPTSRRTAGPVRPHRRDPGWRVRTVPTRRTSAPPRSRRRSRPCCDCVTASSPTTTLLIMAIVNRTPDSFYDRGATYAFDAALERVREVVAAGAEIVDIGGVKAAPGDEVDAAEEIARTVGFVAAGAGRVPRPGHQRRHLAPRGRPGGLRGRRRRAQRRLGRRRSASWPRWRPSSTRRWSAPTPAASQPRTRPHRIGYDDVVADVLQPHDRRWPSGPSRWASTARPDHDRSRATTSARTPGTRSR